MVRQQPGSTPDICGYSWQKRRDYLVLVAAVAAADGELHADELSLIAAVAMADDDLHPDELALLERWIAQFRLGPQSRKAVLAIVRRKVHPNCEAIERRLGRSDLRYSLMLDLMSMAMADGVLMDKEIHMLRGISRNLAVDPFDFNILIEFVHAAHQAAQLSNPEPLYEHNIESAFELLAKKKVRLFPHTLLCVSSPEFDRDLKQRWSRYIRP